VRLGLVHVIAGRVLAIVTAELDSP